MIARITMNIAAQIPPIMSVTGPGSSVDWNPINITSC